VLKCFNFVYYYCLVINKQLEGGNSSIAQIERHLSQPEVSPKNGQKTSLSIGGIAVIRGDGLQDQRVLGLQLHRCGVDEITERGNEFKDRAYIIPEPLDLPHFDLRSLCHQHNFELRRQVGEALPKIDGLHAVVNVQEGQKGQITFEIPGKIVCYYQGPWKSFYLSPFDCQHCVAEGLHFSLAALKGLRLFPQLPQLLKDVEVTQGPLPLQLHVDLLVVQGDGQPGLAGIAESRVLGIGPLEGSALRIAGVALVDARVGVAGRGVHRVLPRDPHVGHAQLLALVGDTGAGQRGREHVKHVHPIPAQAGAHSGLIVVAQLGKKSD